MAKKKKDAEADAADEATESKDVEAKAAEGDAGGDDAKKAAAKKKAAKKKAAAEKKASKGSDDGADRAQGTRPEDLEAAQKKQDFQEKAAEKVEPKPKTALRGGDKRLFEEPVTDEEKAAQKKAAKAKKKKIAKPEYVPPAPQVVQRRTFMKIFGWSGLAGFGAFLGGLAGRFFWPRALFEPPTSFVAGFPSEFAVGEVNQTFQNAYRVWLIREATGMYALIAKCTHLGCTPVWIDSKNKFKCPCHGSGFTKEGVNFEGPAPRPLERARIAQLPDGRVFVDKSRVFRKERGEWEKADAFLAI